MNAKELLKLAKEQLIALKKQVEELKAANEALLKENEQLKAQLNLKDREIQELHQKLAAAESMPSFENPWEPVADEGKAEVSDLREKYNRILRSLGG